MTVSELERGREASKTHLVSILSEHLLMHDDGGVEREGAHEERVSALRPDTCLRPKPPRNVVRQSERYRIDNVVNGKDRRRLTGTGLS